MATIYDIAKKTNLAISTISKVFNNYPYVSEKTRKIVLEAAKELGYAPNATASSLRTKKSWLIGVIIDNVMGISIMHPHYSEILDSFHREISSYGYDMIFINDRFGNSDVSYLQHCKMRGLDGVFLALTSDKIEKVENILKNGYKCVSAESLYESAPTVISDNKTGTIEALEYLYALGHRRIAEIAAPFFSLAGRERHEAYLEFMKSKKLEIAPEYIIETSEYSREEGNKAAAKLLKNTWNNKPTAVFAGCDEFAFSLYNIYLSHGYRIPEDLSIIGFDDSTSAQYANPPLTTVRQSRKEIGRIAGKTLIKLIDDENCGENKILIPTELIIRNSCTRNNE